MQDLIQRGGNFTGLVPRTLDEAMNFAAKLSESQLVPKDFVGKPGNILVAIQWGMELGLQPMQAMQSIAVINGRPSLWGDAVLALVKAARFYDINNDRYSPVCEYVYEEVAADGLSATCRTKRRGEEEQSRTFTKADAEKAKLWGKEGPWTNYPKRMLQLRARSFCLRDVYPDILRGVHVAEEAMDMPPEKEINPRPKVMQPSKKKEAATVEPEPAGVDARDKGAVPPAGAPPLDNNEPAKPNMVELVKKKLTAKTLSEDECFKKFGMQSWDGVTVGRINEILQWMLDPAAP